MSRGRSNYPLRRTDPDPDRCTTSESPEASPGDTEYASRAA